MKPSIYHRAAEAVHSGVTQFSCVAVENAAMDAGEDFQYARDLYASAMCPTFSSFLQVWHFEGDYRVGLTPLDEAREHRVIALLFAAEMARTGDL